MKNGTEELIFYGDDILIERFPSETRFIYPNPPVTPLSNPRSAIAEALDHPLGAGPLEAQLTSRSRITIAFDDPCLPIPLMRNDVRGMVIEALLQRLFAIGIPRRNIRLICANGLHRKWTPAELSLILGRKVVRMIGAEQIGCHDATDEAQLVDLGQTSNGMAVQINRAVAESDLTIYVNINFTSMNGGWKSILVGLGSWQSIRCHHTPAQWNGVDSIMDPDHSPMHAILQEMGEIVKKRYSIFHIETVINNHH